LLTKCNSPRGDERVVVVVVVVVVVKCEIFLSNDFRDDFPGLGLGSSLGV
jgi:hypothetical protein